MRDKKRLVILTIVILLLMLLAGYIKQQQVLKSRQGFAPKTCICISLPSDCKMRLADGGEGYL